MTSGMKQGKTKKTKIKFGQIVEVDVKDIKPSPENDKLYRPVDPYDPAVQDLAVSIRDNGLREPLILSRDNYIISGHRRFMACRLASMTTVQCRYVDVWHVGNSDEFVKLLAEHNKQRVKSLDEQIREAVVRTNPEEAFAELVEHRREKAKVDHDTLLMSGTKKRKKISNAKREFETATVKIVNDLKDFWPLSVRQIHYGHLNDPPLIHSSKPDSRYVNDAKSYRALVDIVARMRLEGTIRWCSVHDETRPVVLWKVHAETGRFVTEEVEDFLKGYHRNLIQSQPNHIEVVVEKNTVAGIVEKVCYEFRIPQTSGRGFCSLPPRYEMARRFRRSGKSTLIVLFISDHDPEGESIAESFARSMRDDFNVESIHPIKVALTADQVREYELPPAMTAKTDGSRRKGFVEQYGENVWELEALKPEILQQIVRDAIEDVLDMDLFNAEKKAELNDSVKLKAIRSTMMSHIGDMDLGTEGDE